MPIISGAGAGGSGTVTAVSSANTSIAVATGTTTPVLTVGTFDVLATNSPPAAAVAMNAKKITGLANGSAATDAAAFGQLPPFTQVDATLAGNVTMTTALTFYDGPSASFAAGTWLIWWKAIFAVVGVNKVEFVARLWDGTTTYDESQNDNTGVSDAGFIVQIAGFTPVTLGSPTTLKVSATASANSQTMNRDVGAGGGSSASTHTASRMTGVRLA